MREEDMYEPIKAWMGERGFTSYPEVECKHLGGRADIVVTSGQLVGVVEMKQSLSLDLIEQALRWRGFAHYIWIAIPYQPKSFKKFVSMVLRDYGIGVLTISKFGSVWPAHMPKLARRTLPDLKEALTEHHRTAEVKGGQSGGGYITPYRITMKQVRHYLTKENQWRTLKDILDHCETHYASPRASLAKALWQFEAAWCERKKEGGKLYFRARLLEGSEMAKKKALRMLPEKQVNVLLALSAKEWRIPTVIAGMLPGGNVEKARRFDSLYVNSPLKALIKKGWVEKNPVGRGQYRLTEAGQALMKDGAGGES